MIPEKLESGASKLAAEIAEIQLKPDSAARRRRILRGWKTAVANWVRNRKLESEGREDLLPLYFIWTTTRACNFSCDYCDDHRGEKYPDLDNSSVLDTDQALRLLEVMRTRTPSLYYAGGEPMMRADLPVLMEHADRLGYFPQTINTNGSLIHTRLKNRRWERFLSQIDVLIVSLDSLNPDVLGPMYRFSRPENIVRNVLALNELKKKYRFKLMVNCVVQAGRVRDAIQVLDFANERGITFAGVPQNKGPRISAELLEDPLYAGFVDRLLQRHSEGFSFAGSYDLNRKLYRALPYECRNTLKPHIDYDGTLLWPCKASVNSPPLRIPVLDFSNVDQIWTHGRMLRDPAGFRGPGPDQCGAECNWAQNYSTDAYVSGLRNPVKAMKELRDFAS